MKSPSFTNLLFTKTIFFEILLGPFQRRIIDGMRSKKYLGLIIESINGEVIPSYATCDLVMNVMKRRWAAEKKIDLLLCNSRKKKMTDELVSS